MHKLQGFAVRVLLLVIHFSNAFAIYTQAGIVITAPPIPKPTDCVNAGLFQRQDSCSYGLCGTECLDQGAFCCGPAGTLATSPYWVCDNGACITSIRGSTGVVDCYDPDNPQGTTQSCIDNVPTTTCQSTDRCYTCSTDEPYCFWQTYIADNSPTLSWFSCVITKVPDATFYAATITGDLTYPTTPFTAPAPSSTPASAPVLSNGAIIGISVGAGVVLIGCAVGIIWCCTILRKKKRLADTNAPSLGHSQLGHEGPAELPPNAPPVFYPSTPPNPSTAYSPTQSSTRFSPSQYQATLAPGEDIEYWSRMTPRGGNWGTEGTPELPTKKASTREREERDRGSYVEGDDWDHMAAH